MTQIMDNMKYKIIPIYILRDLMQRIDNMEEQIGEKSMKKSKGNSRNQKYCNRNVGCL